MTLVMEKWQLAWRDSEYGIRRTLLRQRLADSPASPLVLMLGSSRVAAGFRPEVLLPRRSGQGPEPIVFNFSLVGAGPVAELLWLKRLLRDGIHPDWVFVEYWAPYWYEEGLFAEENRFFRLQLQRLTWRDLPLVSRYSADHLRLCGEWLETHLVPWSSNRGLFLKDAAPCWTVDPPSTDDLWLIVDRSGWPYSLLPDEQHDYTTPVKNAVAFFAPMLRDFRVSPVADRALRDIKDLCRRERISLGMIILPEATAFRAGYPVAARAEVDSYLRRVQREYGIPTIDARSWVPDAEFMDGFHLHPRGAARFTQQFGTQVLEQCLDGNHVIVRQTSFDKPIQSNK
jgi:hypothetical protein